MRHVILTCKNHPNLRWQCKSIAWSQNEPGSREGSYNGLRNIFFGGNRNEETGELSFEESECPCKPDLLMLAPEENPDTAYNS